MEQQECNEYCKDECESKGPLQRKVYYPVVEVDGIFAIDLGVSWVDLWLCKNTGRWAVALLQVPSAGWHGAALLQAQPVMCVMPATLPSSFVGRAQSGLKFAPNGNPTFGSRMKLLQMLAIITVGFWEVRVKKELLYSL